MCIGNAVGTGYSLDKSATDPQVRGLRNRGGSGWAIVLEAGWPLAMGILCR